MASSYGSKLSREDYRRQKDLEAARKAGTAPAERDEEGNEINPHIPQYISQAPWYLDSGAPTLKHQRNSNSNSNDRFNDSWYARGQKVAPAATKYRKGACENCGALTHKTKDCVERPRKLGAKWSGKDIRPDETVQELELSFDGKRDRWNGYDSREHDDLYKEWEMIEEERKKRKAQELDQAVLDGQASAAKLQKLANKGGELSGDDSDDDEEKYAEKSDMPGQKVDAKTRTTVRNLRIREDTAKYLRNLDPDSAYYDPKTRSMRDNPTKDIAPDNLLYAGDNFVRYSGDATHMAKMQLFAWQASDRGNENVHLQANPTQGELLHKEYLEKKDKLKDTTRDSILEKYGGVEHLEAPPKELLLAQTENYVEYSRTGKIIKGQEKIIAKSKYEEDVFINNHNSVWGSYWESGQWGYTCCHSFVKNSYCVPLTS